MRFDVAAELHAYELRLERDSARVANEQSAATAAALVEPELEAMLIGALIADDARGESAIALCEDVELDDFADYRHRAVLRALRELGARGDLPDEPHLIITAIADEIARRDARDQRHVRDTVDLAFLLELVQRHRLGPDGIRYIATRLRDLAAVRRLA